MDAFQRGHRLLRAVSCAWLVMIIALACTTESGPAVPLPTVLENARLRLERTEDEEIVVRRAEPELRAARAEFDTAVRELNAGAGSEVLGLLAYRVQRALDRARWVAARAEGEVDALAERDAQAPPLPGMLEDIRARLEAQHVAVERGSDALVVTLGRQLLVNADLRPRGKLLLDRVAAVLEPHSSLRISVFGDTDSGSAEYAQRLSEGRARSVAEHLERGGIDRSAISAQGRGLSQPRVPNATRAGRRLNRRVELWIQLAEPEPQRLRGAAP